MQLSLELEYWTVDDMGTLASATPVLDRIDDLHAESADPMLEVVTDPCDSVAKLQREVVDRLHEVIEVGREEGRHLVPLGTPLNAGSIATSDGPRTRIQREVLGEEFENATHCAGTHLHVDQIEGKETDQLNLLTALDPAFALVGSSTHHQGNDVATCARPHVYRRKCYGDHPQLGRLWPYVENVEEWNDRVETVFEGFRREALSQGIDPVTFDAHFTSDDSIWAPIRLRDELGTIEWRGPDVALPREILQLTEDIRNVLNLVRDRRVEIGENVGITDSTVTIPEFDRLQGHVNTAIDHGIESPTVERYLDTMGFDPAEYRPVSSALAETPHLSQTRAQWLRLRYASQLEQEIEALTAERPTERAPQTQPIR